MRAQNQQDLIYKRGQAGITKASVTIVFDNSDRSTSPVGLENCKQITVTRQVSGPWCSVCHPLSRTVCCRSSRTMLAQLPAYQGNIHLATPCQTRSVATF